MAVRFIIRKCYQSITRDLIRVSNWWSDTNVYTYIDVYTLSQSAILSALNKYRYRIPLLLSFFLFFLGLFNSSALCHQGRAIMSKCHRGRWERNGPYECRITSVFLPLFFTSVTNNLPVFFLKRTLNLRKKKDVTMAVVVYNDNWLFVLCDLRFIAGLVFFFFFFLSIKLKNLKVVGCPADVQLILPARQWRTTRRANFQKVNNKKMKKIKN